MNKKVLLFALIAGVGVADYFLLRKSKDDLIEDINSLLPAAEKNRYNSTFNKMTRLELVDVNQLIYSSSTGKKITDVALKQRLLVISTKYKIFT